MAGWWKCPNCGEPIEPKHADDDSPDDDEYDDVPCMQCVVDQDEDDYQRKG